MSKAAELAALIGSQTALSNRNLIINGAMQVFQRATSATNPGGGYDTVDRFRSSQNNSGLGNYNAEQSTDAPSGFASSYKLTKSGVTSQTSTTSAFIQYFFEGQDVQQLQYGSSSAKKVTLSFYVKSSVTGQYYISVFNNAADRTLLKGYTIDSADTWEKKTITIIGDQSGTWLTTNAVGIHLMWSLGTGSSYQSSTLDAYQAGFYMAKSDQVNIAASVSSTWQLTGVQLEVGDVGTAFEHEDFATTLAKCQRFFENVEWNGYVLFGNSYSTTQWLLQQIIWKVEKRVAPTLTYPTIGTSANTVGITENTANYVTQGSVIRAFITTTGAAAYNNGADGYSGLTDDSICSLYSQGATTLKVDAEI